jgi:hypothetical protein
MASLDGSTLVFIVMPIVIPLVLDIGIALPFIAARDSARQLSSARQLDRAPQPPACQLDSGCGPITGSAGSGIRDRSTLPVRE